MRLLIYRTGFQLLHAKIQEKRDSTITHSPFFSNKTLKKKFCTHKGFLRVAIRGMAPLIGHGKTFSLSSEGPLRPLPVEEQVAYKRRKPSGISLGGFLHLKTAATYTPPSP